MEPAAISFQEVMSQQDKTGQQPQAPYGIYSTAVQGLSMP